MPVDHETIPSPWLLHFWPSTYHISSRTILPYIFIQDHITFPAFPLLYYCAPRYTSVLPYFALPRPTSVTLQATGGITQCHPYCTIMTLCVTLQPCTSLAGIYFWPCSPQANFLPCPHCTLFPPLYFAPTVIVPCPCCSSGCCPPPAWHSAMHPTNIGNSVISRQMAH